MKLETQGEEMTDADIAEKLYHELSRRITAVQALDYEIRSSWLMDRFAGHLPKWVIAVASRHFSRKSKRRYRRYLASCQWKEEYQRYREAKK